MNFSLLLTVILAYGVLLVNGWTDAPNSIATCVSSGAIRYKKACLICAIFNLLGVIISYFTNTSVAEFMFSLGGCNSFLAERIFAVFLTVILFGIICWLFALPSSESHAMISALVGTSYAVSYDLSGLKKSGYVFAFTVFSCVLAFALAYLTSMLLRRNLPYKSLQAITCSLTSFMHGWQSGLKFLGIICFLLGINITESKPPFFLMLSVGLTLFFGALMGGKRIISSMGENLVILEHKGAFSSDIGTYLTLFLCSLLGMPVSTGNIKCLAIMGVGFYERKKINKKTTTKLLISFIAVFPICFLISYLLMKLLMQSNTAIC